jgi:hypothetical protein
MHPLAVIWIVAAVVALAFAGLRLRLAIRSQRWARREGNAVEKTVTRADIRYRRDAHGMTNDWRDRFGSYLSLSEYMDPDELTGSAVSTSQVACPGRLSAPPKQMGAPEGAHPRLVRVRLAGGPTVAPELGGTAETTGRGTGEPTARVHAAHPLGALTVLPARAEPEVAAGLHEEHASARSRAGVYPAVAVLATPTRDRHVAWGATAAVRLVDAAGVLGERRHT